MGLTVLDAGVIIAILDASDVHHEAAAQAVTFARQRGDSMDIEGLSPRPLPLALTTGPDGARGTAPPLADGTYTLTALIADRAGNRGEATAAFTVDTSLPVVNVVLPVPGSRTREGSPLVRVESRGPGGGEPRHARGDERRGGRDVALPARGRERVFQATCRAWLRGEM